MNTTEISVITLFCAYLIFMIVVFVCTNISTKTTLPRLPKKLKKQSILQWIGKIIERQILIKEEKSITKEIINMQATTVPEDFFSKSQFLIDKLIKIDDEIKEDK